ncbi:MAG: tetratricopeptide repeat protein [Candidatus Edwardsbacteria bacterium]|nr:tetratricopeptide repeat protein [Candidatus Edwardsbacteria bacterium]
MGLALRCDGERVTIDYLTGELDHGLARARTILEHPAAAGLPEVLAKVHSDIGNIHVRRCRFREAAQAFRASIDLADRPALSQHRAVALYNMANAGIIEGHFGEALEIYGRALLIFESLGDVPKAAQVHKSISQTHLRLGNTTAARAAIERSLAMQRRVCNHRAIAACTLDLANILESEGRLAEAVDQVRAAAGWAAQHGITDPYLWAVIHGTDAFMAVEQGDHGRAEQSLRRLIALADANAFTNHLIRGRCLLGLVRVQRGQRAEGLALIEQGLDQATAGGLLLEQLDGWERKAEAYRLLGDVPGQLASLRGCVELSERMGAAADKYLAAIADLTASGA